MLSLVWLRRDLRLYDHAALASALCERATIQPFFVFDREILAQFPNPQDRRLTFIASALCRIDAQLRQRGGELLVLYGNAREIVPRLAQAVGATALFSAEDFEPATRARDQAVQRALSAGVKFVQVLDHLIRAPQSSVKTDGTPYKVFTPFYKQWRAAIGPMDLASYEVVDQERYASGERTRAMLQAAGIESLAVQEGPARLLSEVGYGYVPDTLWGVDDVSQRLQRFISEKLAHYPSARDMLAVDGTSGLSPYLRHGLVSIRDCMRAAQAAGNGEKWISELAWREFYASILYHFPEVETLEFMPQYRHGAIPWSHDASVAQALFEARTGYPVVDAAIRELLTTGTMHNRARMIVASFATKDLHLDWRLGEAFFAQHLMDYELASNNGGWQWAASTGTDAAPYFRVFNPVLQSRKFDPEGVYIKRYLPELKNLSADEIHAPWESPLTKPATYPLPIVDHAVAKQWAVDVFRAAGRRDMK